MVFSSKHIQLDVRVDQHREFWPRNITTTKDKELGLLWTSCVQEPEDTDSETESLPINYNNIVSLINRYTH